MQAGQIKKAGFVQKKGKRGSTSVEVVLVILLLGLFGAAAFSMVFAGGDAYERMTGERDLASSLRISISYVSMRIRHHDILGAIRLETGPGGTGQALVLKDEIGSKTYETWIYCDSGQLMEAVVPSGSGVNPGMAFAVAEVDSFMPCWGEKGTEIILTAECNGSEGPIRYETRVALRSK